MDYIEAERAKEVKIQQLEQAEKDRKRKEKEERTAAKVNEEVLKKASKTAKKEALEYKKLLQQADRDSKKRKRQAEMEDLVTGTALARAIQEYPTNQPLLRRVRAATTRAQKRQGQSQGRTRERSVISVASDLIDPELANWPYAATSQSEYPDLDDTNGGLYN